MLGKFKKLNSPSQTVQASHKKRPWGGGCPPPMALGVKQGLDPVFQVLSGISQEIKSGTSIIIYQILYEAAN